MPGGAVRLRARERPPAHYYAELLRLVVATVLRRYAALLSDQERAFGAGILRLSSPATRLLARLIGRSPPLLREDRLRYAEVVDVQGALGELAEAGLVERAPPAPLVSILDLLTIGELRAIFFEARSSAGAHKGEQVARIAAATPAGFARWRVRRACPWVRLAGAHLPLYKLLFFGDRHQDLTTFVLRDLGVQRFEPVSLGAETRQFQDRASLDAYLKLLAVGDEVAALGPRPERAALRERVPQLVAALWAPAAGRLLERRRSRVLNRLGRALERSRAFDAALTCYGRSTLPPARERRMRLLRRLEDRAGLEGLRSAVLAAPHDSLEAHFAARFARPAQRRPVPTEEHVLADRPASVEAHALTLLTGPGAVGWHLENNLPMGLFALAYWHWIFAPIAGAFVNPFQTGPVDLHWPDFFAARRGRCEDPLSAPLKPRLLAVAQAKAGVANRLFNWRRLTPGVAAAVVEAIPEAHLAALIDIVRGDLAARSSGFPDLTVIRAPGDYEFVEVKGPNDQLQTHQRLWIEALLERGLPVRVLRFRL